jgi:hypothetical protein
MHLLRLAEVMGTSARQIEEKYSRWLTTTDEQLRGLLDDYDAASAPR